MYGGSEGFTWSIAQDGKAIFNHITANGGGTIGGWAIHATKLVGGTLTLNNTGAISGSSWSISADGLAHFSKVYGEVANNYTFVGGGSTMSGGSGGTTTLPSGTRAYVGGRTLQTYIFDRIEANSAYIKDLVAERITASDIYYTTVAGRVLSVANKLADH